MTEKFEKKYDCGILNFWSSNNYGALLTCYALQESVKELGLVPGIINYHCRWEKFEGLLSDRFSRKYLDLTEPCADFEDLRRLNRQMQTFIAGSDQIWRYKYFWPRGKNIYQLSFASLNARKIAYAASFGLDRWEGGYENTLRTKYYMSRFDGISVREDDGVDICREVFGVRAEQVLDPVFLPEPGKWDLLIGNSSCRDEGYVTSYVLDQSPDTLRLVEYVCEKNGIGKTINLVNASKNEVDADVEDWLYHIKNCRFFITDSFHGVCFAILFNKPFICLASMARGYSRFKSLFKLFGLEDRCVFSCEEAEGRAELLHDIDYARVNRILAGERERSLKWLKNALTAPVRERSPEEMRLFETAEMLQRQINELTRDKQILYEALYLPKLKRKLRKYKLKTLFSFGKKHEKYKKAKRELKNKIRFIRRVVKQNQQY